MDLRLKKQFIFKISLTQPFDQYLQISPTYLNINKWVIIIQGPIDSESTLEYLLSSLKSYRKNFPGIKIVIVSYLQDKFFFEKIPNEYFDNYGLLDSNLYKNNFERQVASTNAGLKVSEIYNPEFAIKIRTDQVVSHPAAIEVIEYMLNSFKTGFSESGFRILGSSFNSWAYRPLGLSDMLIAGNFSDMKKYWNYDDDIIDYKLNLDTSNSWISKYNFHYESFLAVRYLLNSGFIFTQSINDDNLIAWKNYFIIVDSFTISQSWMKRNDYWLNNGIVKSFFQLPLRAKIELGFSDWLGLMSGNYELIKDSMNG